MQTAVGAFGDMVRAAREAKGLGRGELARTVKPGAESQLVYRWEKGRGLPQTRELPKIIKALDLDTDAALAAWGEDKVLALKRSLHEDKDC